jgi:hypothetical protein
MHLPRLRGARAEISLDGAHKKLQKIQNDTIPACHLLVEYVLIRYLRSQLEVSATPRAEVDFEQLLVRRNPRLTLRLTCEDEQLRPRMRQCAARMPHSNKACVNDATRWMLQRCMEIRDISLEVGSTLRLICAVH